MCLVCCWKKTARREGEGGGTMPRVHALLAYKAHEQVACAIICGSGVLLERPNGLSVRRNLSTQRIDGSIFNGLTARTLGSLSIHDYRFFPRFSEVISSSGDFQQASRKRDVRPVCSPVLRLALLRQERKEGRVRRA